MQRLLIRDFQLHAAVDDIAFQSVQADDLLIAAAVAEILLGDCPEGVAMHHSMNAVILRRLCADYRECGNLDGRHDGVPAGFILVDDGTVAADLDHIPAELLYPAGNGFAAIVGAARDGHEVAGLDTYRCGLDWVGRLYITAESRSDLGCQIAHAGIHPVAGTGFIRKPPMDGQNHLVRFRGVVQRLGLIAEPEQLRLAVAPADIGAKLHESVVHHILECVRLGVVAGALNGDGSLVVGCGGGTPGAVLLFHIHSDPTIDTDAVVAACLPWGRQKDVAQRFHTALTHHAVRRDAIDAVGTLPGVVRAEFGVGHQGTVCVSHIIHPPFHCGHEAAPARISASAGWAVPSMRRSPTGTHPHSTGRRK